MDTVLVSKVDTYIYRYKKLSIFVFFFVLQIFVCTYLNTNTDLFVLELYMVREKY